MIYEVLKTTYIIYSIFKLDTTLFLVVGIHISKCGSGSEGQSWSGSDWIQIHNTDCNTVCAMVLLSAGKSSSEAQLFIEIVYLTCSRHLPTSPSDVKLFAKWEGFSQTCASRDAIPSITSTMVYAFWISRFNQKNVRISVIILEGNSEHVAHSWFRYWRLLPI